MTLEDALTLPINLKTHSLRYFLKTKRKSGIQPLILTSKQALGS